MAEAMDETPPAVEVRAPRQVSAEKGALRVNEAERKRYGGATVEMLGLLPPATAAPDTTVAEALPIARAHHGQCVLVVKDTRLQGYVDMIDLVTEDTQGHQDTPLGELQRPFEGTREKPGRPAAFRVITPETEVAELLSFLKMHAFALVTDADRTHVLSVATHADVQRYLDKKGSTGPLGTREAEEARKDRSLADTLRMLDNFSPLVRRAADQIPDEVTDFYLERAGFQSEDVRLYVPNLTQETPARPCHREVRDGHCVRRVPVRADPHQRRPEPCTPRAGRRTRTSPVSHRTAHAPCSPWTI